MWLFSIDIIWWNSQKMYYIVIYIVILIGNDPSIVILNFVLIFQLCVRPILSLVKVYFSNTYTHSMKKRNLTCPLTNDTTSHKYRWPTFIFLISQIILYSEIPTETTINYHNVKLFNQLIMSHYFFLKTSHLNLMFEQLVVSALERPFEHVTSHPPKKKVTSYILNPV